MSHNLQANGQYEWDSYYQQIDYIEKNKQELSIQWKEKALPLEKPDRFFDLYLLHLNAYITSSLTNGEQKMDRVLIGSEISVMYLEDNEIESYTICFPEKIDPDNGKISIFSPIGRQLLLKNLGDSISIEIPTGTMMIKIVEINHFPLEVF